MTLYDEVATHQVTAANGISYAYRRTGPTGGRPLVLLQHFRGNLDNWDPALIDELAVGREVITFDNVGVGATSGQTPHTAPQMARDALEFLTALDLDRVDLLGFSLGGFVAQEISLTRPDLVNRLVLAATAPRGAPGMHGWAPEVMAAIGTPHTEPDGVLRVFFKDSPSSQQAGTDYLKRFLHRSENRDTQTTWATRNAQYDAVVHWGIPDHARLERLNALTLPVFVANGDADPMILPRYTHVLGGLLPDATVKVYPDAAHGFLFQHHDEFAADVEHFLS